MKQSGVSTCKDPTTAANFLIDKDLKCEDDELMLELLSIIAMQLLQQLRSTKLALEAFKALSYLILDLHQKNVTASITDSIVEILGLCECSTCLSVSFYLINLSTIKLHNHGHICRDCYLQALSTY